MNANNISIKERIYKSIFNDIVLGEYLPNQVINEKGLMEKFNVSRAPIREALIELCNEKILYSIPYYGYKIYPLTDEDVSSVKAYRCALECTFMRENWEKFTPEILEKLLHECHDNYATEPENDAISHWNNNIRFHLSLFEVYENSYAYEQLNSAMTLQTRAFAQTRWNEWHSITFHDAPEFHLQILNAIRDDQMETAIRMLRTDIASI